MFADVYRMIFIQVLAVVGVIFGVVCCTHSTSSEYDHQRHLRRSLPADVSSYSSAAKPYYNASALTFLREYGQHYRLFDVFYSPNSTIVQTHNNHNEDLHVRYRTRDLTRFTDWNIANSRPREAFQRQTFRYNPPAANDELMYYNNRFRYGPTVNDRFMTIGFDRDPWTAKTTTTTSIAAAVHVYFVGVDTNLRPTTAADSAQFKCRFRQPVAAESVVEIQTGLRNVINQVTLNNVVNCAIPQAVIDALTPEMHDLELDFVRVLPRKQQPHNEQQEIVEVEEEEVMLGGIVVPRMHELDRRRYQHVVQTMVEVLDDVMVKEWLIYNILLGIEHFYIYYNVKHSDVDLSTSILRPFLDANLVTLIYYPFLHTYDFGFVQQAAMNAFLHQFGAYTEWVGYWDVDEFFLPATKFRPTVVAVYSQPIVPTVTQALAHHGEPGIMFETLEMDCAPGANNFYMGGNNMHNAHGGNGGTTTTLLVNVSALSATVRNAVTTHCERTGFQFHEMKQGHGKMFIRPSKVLYMHSPHRLNDYFVVWTDPDNGGTLRHFNKFRNTYGMIRHGDFSEKSISTDSTLKNFTLLSLQALVGVSERPPLGSRS
jgi:hypothetical protein